MKGDSEFVPASLPGMAQIRMSRRIQGAYLLSDQDAGKHFEDNIGATRAIGAGRDRCMKIPYRDTLCAF
jgi:hypothetical protein